jgi:hypothetical protein
MNKPCSFSGIDRQPANHILINLDAEARATRHLRSAAFDHDATRRDIWAFDKLPPI